MKRPDSDDEALAFMRLIRMIDVAAICTTVACCLWLLAMAVVAAWRAWGWLGGSVVLAVVLLVVVGAYYTLFRSRLQFQSTDHRQKTGDEV